MILQPDKHENRRERLYQQMQWINPSVMNPVTVRKWLKISSPEQLAALKEILDGFFSMPETEQQIIRYMLTVFLDQAGNELGVHDMLSMRQAFIGPTVQRQLQYKYSDFLSLTLGVRDDIMKPLDLSDPDRKRGYEALLSFGFETTNYNLGSTREVRRPLLLTPLLVYVDRTLKELVAANADRVEVLIEYALRRKTVNPEILSMMLDESTSPALNDGIL